MAETPIVSETLQQTFRSNFPSQVSSGRDLHVSDTIIPIVDFSSTAGTTGLSQDLQEAVDMTITAIKAGYGTSVTTVTINTPGFWFYQVYSSVTQQSASNSTVLITIDDGTTTKEIFSNEFVREGTASDQDITGVLVKNYVYLRSGDNLKFVTDGTTGNSSIRGYARQIASTSGELVDPNGYTS
jgi:hypothetical protein